MIELYFFVQFYSEDSAQVLLQKFKCRDVLEMSVEDMKNAKLDLPESTLQVRLTLWGFLATVISYVGIYVDLWLCDS